MDQEINIPLEELPFEVDEEKLGVFLGAELICPGLYLVGTKHGGCFVVLKERAENIFSSEAMAYGMEDGNAVFFPCHDGQYGDQVIRYEVGRHMALLGRHTLPLYDSPHTQAFYGAKEASEYFGAPVPPVDTPHGRMTRYLELDKGIFMLETEQFEQMLAVCYPIWDEELTSTARALAEMTEYDRSTGMNLTMGYLFFSRKLCAAPLYELMQDHSELGKHIVSEPALISAIWAHCPAYAVMENMQEQMGLGACNSAYHLACAMGVDAPELEQPPKDFIPYIEDMEDTEFLKLPDSWRLDRALKRRVET